MRRPTKLVRFMVIGRDEPERANPSPLGNSGPTVEPEDIGRAGRGELGALRRLRDYWLAVASGASTNEQLPEDMVLPQVEMLAEMAAAASDQLEDRVPLIVAYQIRAETLQRDLTASEALAKRAVESDNAPDLDRWTSSIADLNVRLGRYGLKVGALVSEMLSDPDVSAAAHLVAALSQQADRGDDGAMQLLQFVIDTATSDQAQAMKALVRRAEQE